MTHNAIQTALHEAPAMLTIDPDLVAAMRQALPPGHPSRVMQAYGISWNTWNKLRDHQPIRRSVAKRLLERIGMDGALITQHVMRIAAPDEAS
ncbi:hypothetical protein D0Z70_22900 [Sphingobium terrigena]|uniref:XRE family transcriptional regulator n=1 Tax=Sphingobium terrigena TaxID=2304063 RepID=A0A418YL79_9SPHN|nr:hypothetical protein [Sphingobium terrigena]RJG51731.1 hypothetical protein D0Z70_22900 [Sphingobium terrigena]